MYKLNSLKDKLNKIGYSVFIKEGENGKFLKGGYSGDDIEKNLSIHIKVTLEENKFVFIDWDKQMATKIIFLTVEETVNFIKEKYPL
mgnify:CR=1 FL=1